MSRRAMLVAVPLQHFVYRRRQIPSASLISFAWSFAVFESGRRIFFPGFVERHDDKQIDQTAFTTDCTENSDTELQTAYLAFSTFPHTHGLESLSHVA